MSGAFDGRMDEIRMSKGLKSFDYINHTYLYTSNPSRFETFGTEETYEDGTDTCTYSGSGNFVIDWSENCTWNDPVVGDGSDFLLEDCGVVTLEADISGFTNYYFIPSRQDSSCFVYQMGGHFK